MKIKTSELTGAALDWAVAKAEGHTVCPMAERDHGQSAHRALTRWAAINVSPAGHDVFAPSTDWSQAGPIIEREKIELLPMFNPEYWQARVATRSGWFEGSIPLTAAMRCYVASKLGEKVEVPEELL